MNKFLFIVLLFVIGGVLSFRVNNNEEITELVVPEGWPDPIYNFQNNPISEEGFQLGRKLFYDPFLSRDGTISCANCHLQYTGFTHVDHNVSHGIDGKKGTRNSPALINLAWNSSFHWDGGVNNLEMQGLNPIKHPAEMDNSIENVLKYLKSNKEYKAMFYNVFGDSTISTKMLLKGLTQFTASLISSNSKYDKFIRKEEEFTKQEKNGLKIFNKHCSVCHKAPLFNSNKYASNGLNIDTSLNDIGRYAITDDPTDSLKFRIPTLRNIEYTFPYMHDGRYRKLKQVIDYYVDSLNVEQPYLSNELKRKMRITPDGKKDLIAFLRTLTDREFLYDRRFSFPR